MEPARTIEPVVQQRLCHGCGTCAGMCPVDAIAMQETVAGYLAPQIDDEMCTRCGLCARLCPGARLPEGLLDDNVDPFKGNVLEAFLVRAVDEDVLSGAQSGGVVSALLCHRLATGESKRAVVSHMPTDVSLRPVARVVTTRDEILASRGSLYCPIPVNTVLGPRGKGLEPGTDYVGLGCQVHGLRSVQASQPGRVDDSTLVIGLVCAGVLSCHAIEYLASLSDLPREHARHFAYRSKRWRGWPGDVCIRADDGADHWVPKTERHRCKRVFESLRCRLCFDQMNALSDLIVGDAWGFKEDARGLSAVIARTEKGLAALRSAEAADQLSLEPVAAEAVFEGQKVDSRHRGDWTALRQAWNELGGAAPDFGIDARWHGTPSEGDRAECRQRLESNLEFARVRSPREARRIAKRRLWRMRTQKWLASKGVPWSLQDPIRLFDHLRKDLRRLTGRGNVTP